MLHRHAIRYPCAMSGPSASERRIEALDGLRGLAILLVIPHNAGRIELPGQPDRLWHPETWLPWLFDHVLQAGWSGVQLFFVLSGFLITGILVDSKRSARYFSSFYVRRALRILPVYVFALVMVLYVLPAATGSLPEVTENLRFQGWYWTFLANWVQPLGWEIPGLSHFWSLAIEEQFYLLWPIVVLLLPLRSLLWLAIALMVVAFGSRIALLAADASVWTAYQFTFCRMDALAAGAIVALALRDEPLRAAMTRHVAWLLPAMLFVLGAGFVVSRGYEPFTYGSQSVGYSLLAIGCALLVARVSLPGIARGLPERLLGAAWLRSMGKYSYAMYVLHAPLYKLFGDKWLARLMGPGPYSVPVCLAYASFVLLASYALAVGSYHLLERPFLQLKDRLAPRPNSTQPLPSTSAN